MARPSQAVFFPAVLHPKKRAFLFAYARCLQIKASATIAKVDHQLHYYWKQHDAVYAVAFEEAKAMGIEALEDEAIRRATHIKQPSDTLLIFLLKGAMPAKYRERHEVTGEAGGPMQIRVVYEDTVAPVDDLG